MIERISGPQPTGDRKPNKPVVLIQSTPGGKSVFYEMWQQEIDKHDAPAGITMEEVHQGAKQTISKTGVTAEQARNAYRSAMQQGGRANG